MMQNVAKRQAYLKMFLKMSVAVKGFWRSFTFVVESLEIQFGLTSDSL